MIIYFAAEVWRGRIRRETLRFFTDGTKAVEYYRSLKYRGTIWKASLDKNSPPKTLKVDEIKSFMKTEST